MLYHPENLLHISSFSKDLFKDYSYEQLLTLSGQFCLQHKYDVLVLILISHYKAMKKFHITDGMFCSSKICRIHLLIDDLPHMVILCIARIRALFDGFGFVFPFVWVTSFGSRLRFQYS